MAAHPLPVQAFPRLSSVEQVTDLLGLSKQRVYELMNDGELPSIKIGRRRFIEGASLEALIERSREGGAAA